MFDDPKKDLKWLEQQLLAKEQFQDDADEEDEQWEAPRRMSARTSQPEDVFRFLEEDAEEEPEFFREESLGTSRKRRKKRKEKRRGCLVFLVWLETLVIIALLIWWLL